MLFYILMLLSLAVFVLPTAFYFMLGKDSEAGFAGFMVGFIFSAVALAITVGVWGAHAGDLGTITAQHEIISVYESRRDDLQKTLREFDYPSPALLNADSPVKAIVDQLANVETELAKAKARKAEAIVSIEKRRKGPMSGVIGFVGDYK